MGGSELALAAGLADAAGSAALPLLLLGEAAAGGARGDLAGALAGAVAAGELFAARGVGIAGFLCQRRAHCDRRDEGG